MVKKPCQNDKLWAEPFAAVRYKLAVDAYLRQKGCPFRALVAFSGTVRDGGVDFTETGMNTALAGKAVPETATAETFKQDEYRLLIVANKFQTGFDQPLLHTMYVDKKLGGVNAVQTLSRFNRNHPDKDETMVLDFANEAEEIQKAFRLKRTGSAGIKLEKGTQELEPMTPKDGGLRPEDLEPLSQIIKELNERFGTDFTEQDKVFIRQLEQRVHKRPGPGGQHPRQSPGRRPPDL